MAKTLQACEVSVLLENSYLCSHLILDGLQRELKSIFNIQYLGHGKDPTSYEVLHQTLLPFLPDLSNFCGKIKEFIKVMGKHSEPVLLSESYLLFTAEGCCV